MYGQPPFLAEVDIELDQDPKPVRREFLMPQVHVLDGAGILLAV